MLTFRPYKNCDAEIIATWVSDEKTFYQWSADIIGAYPMSSKDLNIHYEKQANNTNFFVFTACDETAKPVGHMIMRYLDDSHKKVRFGFVIVDNNVRGKGYGKEMLLLAEKYALELLHAEEITLGVFANNEKAFYCYQAAGFEEFGERTKYAVNGEEWECIEMRYTRNAQSI
ncbi:MAG: GNAT family N-acetyltransferase [Lachnospiraceae bacterium]|nr:GNAT family N-acetyltransferase [Lachnospiraceae bacterium]